MTEQSRDQATAVTVIVQGDGLKLLREYRALEVKWQSAEISVDDKLAAMDEHAKLAVKLAIWLDVMVDSAQEKIERDRLMPAPTDD